MSNEQLMSFPTSIGFRGKNSGEVIKPIYSKE